LHPVIYNELFSSLVDVGSPTILFFNIKKLVIMKNKKYYNKKYKVINNGKEFHKKI